VQQLNAVLRRSLIALADRVPLLPGAEQMVFVDLDSAHRQVYGYAKQGAQVGRLKGKKTLHPLIVVASTPIARPVVVAIRLRKGKAADVRGAPRLLAEALTTVRAIAPTARIVVRGDSKFYTADVVATAARYDAAVSLTTGSNPSVNAAIGQIPDTGWTAIHYPQAFVDEETGELVSDAEVAEIGYTAFTSRRKAQHVRGQTRRLLGVGHQQAGLAIIDPQLHAVGNAPRHHVQESQGLAVNVSRRAATDGNGLVIVNAVCDAIGVRHVDMPCTPSRVWDAMQGKGTPPQ